MIPFGSIANEQAGLRGMNSAAPPCVPVRSRPNGTVLKTQTCVDIKAPTGFTASFLGLVLFQTGFGRNRGANRP